MEVIDNIFAWQIEPDDLIRFETYDDDRWEEIILVESVTTDIDTGIVRISGESLVTGGTEDHVLDIDLEVELMGA